MLIDKFLSDFNYRKENSLTYSSSYLPDASLMFGIDLSKSWLIKVLFSLRGLPSAMHSFKGFLNAGFILLEQSEHEIVMGLIGQPWKLNERPRAISAVEFYDFDEPGFIKVATNFKSGQTEENLIQISTEKSIICTSSKAKRNFGLYWFAINYFSGLIRIEMLKLIRNEAKKFDTLKSNKT